MKKIPIILLLLLLSLNLFAQSDWTVFRGNRQLTASSTEEIPDRLKLLFSFQTDDDIKSSPVVKNGIIYFGSTDGYFYAIDFEGKLKWKFNSENAIEAPAIIVDKSIIFGNMDGWFFSLNCETGKLNWKYETENQIVGSASWEKIKGQLVAAVGSYDYYLHGVDLRSGANLWKYESDNFINGAPALWNKHVVLVAAMGFCMWLTWKKE